MSNVGKWDKFYVVAPAEPVAYGDSDGYRLGAKALADCDVVEDWGCGLGWFSKYLDPKVKYVGIDGSCSPHATIIDDLATRRSQVEGIFMRGVLEHNYDWPTLLENALASFTKRFVLVLFTPWAETAPHEELQFEHDYGVPTLALHRDTLIGHLAGFMFTETGIRSPETTYRNECVFVIERAS